MTEAHILEAKKLAFPISLAVTFFAFIDTHLLIPIISLYAKSKGAGVGMTGLIVGLYSITNTPANIFFGRAIDKKGYRIPLIIGLL
jgi:MFS family permease